MSYARDEVMTWATGQVDQGADDHVDQVRELAEKKFAEIQKLERRLRSMYDAAVLEGDQEEEAEVIGNSIREQVRVLLPGMSADAEHTLCSRLWERCTAPRPDSGDAVANSGDAVATNANSRQLELILQRQTETFAAIAKAQVRV